MRRDRYFLNKIVLLILLLIGGGILLTACESPHPAKANILPDGYVWHDSSPLESPPKTRPWLVEADIDPTAQALSKEQWLHAADDLVTSLREQKGGLPAKVLLQPVEDGTSAIKRSFDSYLRELLITRNVTLTTNPAEAEGRLVYDAGAPNRGTSLTGGYIINTRTKTMDAFLQDLEGKPVLQLSLALKSGSRIQAIARGLYHVHGQETQRYEWALMPVPRYEKTFTHDNFNE